MITEIDHWNEAERYLYRADEILNRDGHLEFRDVLADRFLQFAAIHAQLATAQKIDTLNAFLFDHGRALNVSVVHG